MRKSSDKIRTIPQQCVQQMPPCAQPKCLPQRQGKHTGIENKYTAPSDSQPCPAKPIRILRKATKFPNTTYDDLWRRKRGIRCGFVNVGTAKEQGRTGSLREVCYSPEILRGDGAGCRRWAPRLSTTAGRMGEISQWGKFCAQWTHTADDDACCGDSD